MKKILVPTDFSEIAENATEYAIHLAKKTKHSLVFFHAEEHKTSHAYSKLTGQLTTLKQEEPTINADLIVSDKLFNSISIQEESALNEVSFVVMGTSGKDADLHKKMFGTNTSEISENVNYPVLVIPPGVKFTKINKIAYASDLYHLQKELTEVINFARPFNAEVLVFHVTPVFPDLGDVEKRNIPKELELLKDKLAYENIYFHSEKTKFDNQTHKGIDRFVGVHKPDVLVLFHMQREGIDEFISSTESDKAVSAFDIPVLIMHK